MSGLDGTDKEILRLLMENARRPYNEIAEQVNLSPPTVSNRIDRLREHGLIRRFTLDMDRSMLREGDSVFVELRVQPGATDEVVDTLEDSAGVKHIFELVDSRVLFHAYMTKQGIQELIAEQLADRHILEYDVGLVTSSRWNPQVNEEDLVMECVLCGRSVTGDGVSVQLGDQSYELCCSSCASLLAEQHEELRQAANEE